MSSALRQENPDCFMSDQEFAAFQRITMEQTGIELSSSKRAMIVNRFNRRLTALNLTSYEDYLRLVCEPGNPEAAEFIDTVTTNLTYFFRETHHFDVFSRLVLPTLSETQDSRKPIRIWSAGCSSGQEPYSLAIAVLESEAVKNREVRILCTDIHTKMVSTTESGTYTQEHLRGLSEERKQRWFERSGENSWTANEALRSLLICRQLNLFGPWPVKAGVDVIMCRNVLIYFNSAYQRKLLEGFSNIQSTGGYLFLGHSETLEGFSGVYKRVDNTVYERV